MNFGPCKLKDNRWRFRLWAPAKEAVELEIDGAGRTPMQRREEGVFEIECPADVGARYRFQIGDMAVPDPAARAQAKGDVHGWSALIDPDAYVWRTKDWRGRPWEETVLYEVHVGLYGGYAGVMAKLEEWLDLGITALELMPLAEVSGTRNWGYDGVLPYAPAAAYGSPEDLKRLLDRAHELGLMMFLDVVYNHFGPDGNYLNAYAPQVFDEKVHTPWGGAIDFARRQVRDFFTGNAIYWTNEFRFDGLRFDAVHAIKDQDWLTEMASAVRAATRGRHVHLVLENENNAASLLRGPFNAQWNDDFHNVLHVLLTGERGAYYQDFADEPANKLARCLSEGFIYQGEPSPNHDGQRRGEPSDDLPPTAFVSFLQNHDQVGNRAMGERLTRLAEPAALRAATALTLLTPQIPLIFMGEDVGSETPFLFFTDFHDELADAVRDGRRKEFAKFPEFSDPKKRDDIPDPNAKTTFEDSRPAPGPQAETSRAFYRELLALRRRHIVGRLEGAKSEGAQAVGSKAVVAHWRMGDGARLTLALNLDGAPVAAVQSPARANLIYGVPSADGRLAPLSLLAWLESPS